MTSLSILIVVHNEEKQLESCLKNLLFGDELVIILDKCTDKSKQISRKFTKKIFSGAWEIEGDRRNFGLNKCNCEWILEIDSDERISKKLAKEILEVIKTSKKQWHLINVNNYLGKKVVKNGWGAYMGKSSYAGLFKKNTKIWGKQRVHPKIFLKGKQGETLKNSIDHFYCKSISDLIDKLNS